MKPTTILCAGAILLLAIPPALAAPTANGLQGGRNNAGWNNGGGYASDFGGRQGDVPLQDLKKHDAYGIAKREGWKLAPGGYRYTPNTDRDKGNPGRSHNSKQAERESNGGSNF